MDGGPHTEGWGEDMSWRYLDSSLGKPRTSDAVLRALIVLKGLTRSVTGGIVASPTTALPE